jgi:hypothetical protein
LPCSSLHYLQKYPDLGVVVAGINTVLYPLRWLGLFPFLAGTTLDLEALMAECTADTGLSDWGDLGFVRAYRRVAQLPAYRAQAMSNFGFLSGYACLHFYLTSTLDLVYFYCRSSLVLV